MVDTWQLDSEDSASLSSGQGNSVKSFVHFGASEKRVDAKKSHEKKESYVFNQTQSISLKNRANFFSMFFII